jgi:hypothetical protein
LHVSTDSLDDGVTPSTADRVTQICQSVTDTILALTQARGNIARARIDCSLKSLTRKKRELESISNYQVTINPPSSDTLPAGYVVAIVLGSLAGVLLFAGAIWLVYKTSNPKIRGQSYEGV